MVHHKNPLWKIPLEIIDHLKIKDKTLIVPDFLFGVTFDKGAQPYQDFSVLLQVRNRFVHFKNETEMPIKNVSKYLGDKGLLMEAPKPQDVPDDIECDYPWPAKFACTEMVRWAINTVAAMAAKLESFIPEKDSHAVGLCQNFRRVDELWVRSWYASHSIIIDRN